METAYVLGSITLNPVLRVILSMAIYSMDWLWIEGSTEQSEPKGLAKHRHDQPFHKKTPT
jgi:hypothetical protein